MKKLTDSHKKFILKLLDAGHYTDSTLEDIFEENNIPCGEAFRFIAEMSIPDRCKGCKYVSFYRSMFPCTSCKRSHPTDYYEQEEEF